MFFLKVFFVKIGQNLRFEGSQRLFQVFLSGGVPKIISGELIFYLSGGHLKFLEKIRFIPGLFPVKFSFLKQNFKSMGGGTQNILEWGEGYF